MLFHGYPSYPVTWHENYVDGEYYTKYRGKPIEKDLPGIRKSNSMIITSGVSSSVRFNFG